MCSNTMVQNILSTHFIMEEIEEGLTQLNMHFNNSTEGGSHKNKAHQKKKAAVWWSVL